MVYTQFLRFLRYRWRLFYFVLVLVIVLPIAATARTSEAKCGFVILIMACYWVVEPIPVEATSLLPIVLFPLLSVISTKAAASPYMNNTNFMFIGGLMMAVGIETCNLHKRIALAVLLRVGAAPKWMMMGFMCSSMFLSLWISNTATAAMMVPILEAILTEMERKYTDGESYQLSTITSTSPPLPSPPKIQETHTNGENEKVNKTGNGEIKDQPGRDADKDDVNNRHILRKALYLSIAYATNIGGTGTLTGTGPNLVLKGLVEELFPESNELSFGKWMLYNIPVMLICVALAWTFLMVVYLRRIKEKEGATIQTDFREIIRKKYDELGRVTFPEIITCILFTILVLLWVFRDPQFVPGWAALFPKFPKIDDATPAIGIPLLMFIIPKDPRKIGYSAPLLDWKTVHRKLPWGIVLLLGSGFSIAEASKLSGLSKWAGESLRTLNIGSPLAIVTVLCLLTAALTEFTSNVATANILLPVIANLALALKVNPLYFMIPVTISCSFAFMLPVATPPNAIVFEAAKMSTVDMMVPGLFINFVCCAIEILMINTLGYSIFNFGVFPAWANSTLMNKTFT